MLVLPLLFSFALLLVCCLGELVTLTDEDFDKQFASNDWLIKFYAPWCSQCRPLKPVFEELASKVSHAGIGEMDATKNKLTATKYNITSFPTILYKQDGNVGKYDGARTLEGISFFLDRMNSPAYLEILSIDEIGAHSAFSDNVTFVLAFSTMRTEAEFQNKVEKITADFKSVASKLKQHASFAIMPTSDTSYIANYGDISVTKVEPGRVSVAMKSAHTASADPLTAFVEANNYPLVSHFDNHNFKRLSHIAGKYIVAAVVDYERTEETSAILAGLEHALSPSSSSSMQDQDKLIFGHLDGVKWRTFIKHHRTMLPAVLLLDQANDLHQTFPLPALGNSPISTYEGALEKEMSTVVQSVLKNLNDKSEWRTSEPPTLFEKISYRFTSYYPWSLAVILLPVTFVCMSIFAPYPKEKKIKLH